MSDARTDLRRELRARRRALPAAVRIAAAEAVARRLLGLPFAPTRGYVAGYWAMDGELALHAWQLRLPPGLVYCLPVLHEDGRLRFGAWRTGDPLVANRYGIPEPELAPDRCCPADACHSSSRPWSGSTRRAGDWAWALAGTIAASRSATDAHRHRGWWARRSPRNRSTPSNPCPGTSRSTHCAPNRTRTCSGPPEPARGQRGSDRGMSKRKRYWLMKTEPTDFSIRDLKRVGTEPWTGVRNYQARNFMRQMTPGDGVLFYHSNCEVPGIYGIGEVASLPYPDPTQFRKTSKYFDPKATREEPRWQLVDVGFVRELDRPLPCRRSANTATRSGRNSR
jgi:predicted RNA-binding protein with PUA-like domain